MSTSGLVFKILDNIESIVCRTLLALFVILLFAQIVSREIFSHSISWSEELAVYMFVWFVFFGASYAAKLSAHNRVVFQFKWLPKKVATFLEFVGDMIWVAFNVYFTYLAYDFIFNRMNNFWKSQTLGIPMKYIYLILPIAFALMTIRIIQINYYKLIKGIDIRDPESQEVEKLMEMDTGMEPENKQNGNKSSA